MNGRWELSGFTVYAVDLKLGVNKWNATVYRNPRCSTEGEASDVARLMRAAKEMADMLGRVLEEWRSCEAARCPGDFHEFGMGQLHQEAVDLLRSAGRLP